MEVRFRKQKLYSSAYSNVRIVVPDPATPSRARFVFQIPENCLTQDAALAVHSAEKDAGTTSPVLSAVRIFPG
jgi:hypothetical protein